VEIYDPNPQLRNVAIGRQEIVRWRNAHGHDRQGVFIFPVGFQEGHRYPLIVSAYSQGTHLNAFAGNPAPAFGSQVYAGLGYAVFFPGPRVPWMYGGATTRETLGGADGWELTFDDVESGVDVLIERGIVDADRMAIMGFSNGGAVAAALMTHTRRYKAAIAVAPANLNWLQSALHQDNQAERWMPTNTFVGVDQDILDDPEEYLRGSVVFRMSAIETPMLLAVGDRDDSSFLLPTIQIYLGLRRLDRDITLLRYAGMPHGFFGPSADDLNGRILEFLDRHLNRMRR
jgi:dipeptidyl aminopeptidase/acylaminoacyl peptidase